MRKPRICIVSHYNCIRVTKEATVLKKLGYEVHLLTNFMRNYQVYDTAKHYRDRDELEQAIKVYDRFTDIFHYHNQPDWPVATIRKLKPKARIVNEIHDSNYWLLGHQTVDGTTEKVSWYDEDLAVDCSDAFVVPSKPCKEELKGRTSKPIIDLPPACPLEWYEDFKANGFWGGLVIQGGIAVAKLSKIDSWRDYTNFLQTLNKRRNVFIYSPCFTGRVDDKLDEHYRKLSFKTHKFEYYELIKALGEHSWNLVGNISREKLIAAEYSMHNKLFDAIAAGIPSVVFGVKEAIKFVEKYDIGISCETINEMLERWDEHSEKRKNLMLVRESLAMENYIGELEKLYESL